MPFKPSEKLFGTDGVRGKANIFPMTPDTVLRLAQCAAASLSPHPGYHGVVIGKDTRLSGYMIEPALTAGFISMGLDVFLVGPLPTPAIAMLTRSLRAQLGVMISASHNPASDNGLKFFGEDGSKLSCAVQDTIEKLFHQDHPFQLVGSTDLGHARRLDDAPGRYIEYVKSVFPKKLTLEGLTIVLDCANGAAYKVAPLVFKELGAHVITIGDTPDGHNINDGCGVMDPGALIEAVLEHKAHMGIAMDGDADRLLMVDEYGKLINGDCLLALLAQSYDEKSLLQKQGVVGTVMSNLGLEAFLQSINLHLIRTPVGDRHISDYMRTHGYNVGGEQSGHIIIGEEATSGDALLSALQVLAALLERQVPASYLSSLFTPFPQIIRNISHVSAQALEQERVVKVVNSVKDRLGSKGRILIRPSGTEPLLRIMIEGEDDAFIQELACEVIEVLEFEKNLHQAL